MRRCAPLVLVVGALLLAAGDVRAQEESLCIAPHEQGQELRQEGRLRAARDRFRECTRESCPAPVRVDCTKWVEELGAAIPTIVVHAQDATGRDVTGAQITMDGAPVTPYVEGRAFEVDPGPHVLRVVANGRSADLRLIVREAERERAVPITLRGSEPPPQPPPPPPERRRPIPTLAWVFGGVGVVGLGAFATLGYVGWRHHDDLRGTCGTHCTDADTAPIRREYAVGDISLAVGVVSLGVATWLVLTRPSVPGPGRASTTLPAPGGGRAY